MELVEVVPIEKIKFLSKMSYSTFKVHTDKCKTEKERKEYYEQFKSYCRAVLKTKGETKRLYHYTEKSPDLIGGRLFSGGSIQGLACDFRGFLMQDTTTDIDIKNCHPVILEHLCKLHHIECPILSYYVENRTEILNRLGTSYKTAFLCAVNTEKINRKITDSFFKKFDKECKEIQKKICDLEDYKYITKHVPVDKSHNWLGSAINRILCVKENEILQVIIGCLTKHHIKICALMFDGCLIYGNYYEHEELLREIENTIYDKLFINVTLTYKKHSTSIEYDPSLVEEEDEEEEYNDIDEAIHVLSKYKHWVLCNDELYVFDDTTGLWTTCMHTKRRIVAEYARGKYKKQITAINALLTALPSQCNIKNDKWIEQNRDTSLGKLLFNDGYYDAKLNQFINKFDPSILFFGKIHLDYKGYDNEEIEKIKQKLFIDTLGDDVGNFQLQHLARALLGDKMKHVAFGLGNTNCGKSTIGKAFKKSCGDYIGNFEPTGLSIHDRSSDAAQGQRWALLNANKRIIFSQELSANIVLSGTKLKKHSGGDDIQGRLHGGNETDFEPHYNMILFGNDMPDIEGYDEAIDKRLIVFGYSKQFVDSPKEEHHLQKDDELIQSMNTIKFQINFIQLLIQSYQSYKLNPLPIPEICTEFKKVWVAQDVGCMTSFLQSFEITNILTDTIKSSDIEDWLKDKKIGIKMKKFTMEMKEYTKKHKLDNVDTKHKKLGNIWTGIKQIIDDDPEELDELS